MIETARMADRTEQGFTLLEALIAIAILSIVTLSMLSTRTDAVVDATEARNWLIAREKAQQILSQLQAGHREIPPVNGERYAVPGFEEMKQDWWAEIAIGEEFISEAETKYTATDGSEEGEAAQQRLEWQRNREDIRAAEAAGMSVYDYRTQREEKASNVSTDAMDGDVPIAEDEFVEIAVFVFFPNVRPGGARTSHFSLKARISTMALNGMTPEEAETLSATQGGKTGEAGASGTGSSGSGDAGR